MNIMTNNKSKFKGKLCLILFTIIITLFNVQNSSALTYVDNISIDKDKKIVYLTFDDGPSPIITDKLLDVLKKYDVKATFFVVGKEIPGREKILSRIYEEGHSIGLHTYSHNIKKVYSSEDNFIKEMNMARDKVAEVTGYKSNIIRFPGGSSRRMTKHMLEELHENNFKVYDWNVNLEDGVKPTLPVNTFINNAKKYSENYNRLIILMHCNYNNINTVKALPGIIEYYKSLDYRFEPITDNTKEYYYRLKK